MIRWYRFLDWLQSFWNRSHKALNGRRRYGAAWRDMVRSGRHYSRVEYCGDPLVPTADNRYGYQIRTEPGWLWTCFNCKTQSLALPSMVAIWMVENETVRSDLMQEWQDLAQNTVARGFKPPVKPTPATAGCPNCKARPGAPE